MSDLLRYLRGREKEIIALLGKFVACESPSGDKAAVDRFGEIVAREWRSRGASVHIFRQRERGNHVRAEISPGHGEFAGGAGQIMVLGHLDTVYPMGTIRSMPFRLSRGRAWGPGTFDMKAGHVMALFAVDALRTLGVQPRKRLVFLWNSDEEIGSETSRQLIEREALRSDAVLVLEPALGPDGRLKTQRKGVGTAELIVSGRAAHAGINPQEGVNAVHELAAQIVRLVRWNDPRRGITVQATVVAGGTVSNVVPDSTRAEIDLRYARLADARLLERKLRGLRPILKGARIEIRGGITRPPLERTAGVEALFRRAQSLGREIGLDLGESSTGGGSDGSFAAALGIRVLDGLGAVGEGAHSPGENVTIRALPQRTALVAGLLASV
ncbi:MAG TPA: M20 family metallopeptidase [Candidatus Acidoferrales bacterium]|nr:M20 family metallopeptidase [Candidatus Acidoferrales bacterium]